jgi:hypothetical protein
MLPNQRKRQSGLSSRQDRVLSMTAEEYALGVSEKEWQAWVIEYAKLRGWWVMHILRPIGTQAGWPDLTLLRGREAIYAELKRQDGKLSLVQKQVLAMLECAGQRVYVWRPDQRDLVQEILY